MASFGIRPTLSTSDLLFVSSMNDNIHVECCRTIVSSSQMCSGHVSLVGLSLASRCRAFVAQPLGVAPRVSPTLAAAEGHQRVGPSHPSWRVG